MRTIFHLIFLGAGFFGGIYVGLHYHDQAKSIDEFRIKEQSDLAPQIQRAVAQAKIELLNRLQQKAAAPAPGGNGLPFNASGFAGAGPAPAATPNPALQQTMNDELAKAQKELDSAK